MSYEGGSRARGGGTRLVHGWACRVRLQCSPDLQDWISIQRSVFFDSMHQYWSNGIVAQELGLWHTRLLEHGVTLQKVRAWVSIGWRAHRTRARLLPLFSPKLFRAGKDFRGDASACLLAMPLCWAFSCELLSTRDELRDATRSLNALHDVARCLERCKINPKAASRLSALQEVHMQLFVSAYGAAEIRPKWHYALHLQQQIQMSHRHLDCFVGERKHRFFKSDVAPNQRALWCMQTSTLHHLTEKNLKTAFPASCMQGRMLGALRALPPDAKHLKLPTGSRFSRGAEIGCVEYCRGDFLPMSSQMSVQVHGAVGCGEEIWLLLEPLARSSADKGPLPKWKRRAGRTRSLLPLRKARGCPHFSLVREGAQSVWFL